MRVPLGYTVYLLSRGRARPPFVHVTVGRGLPYAWQCRKASAFGLTSIFGGVGKMPIGTENKLDLCKFLLWDLCCLNIVDLRIDSSGLHIKFSSNYLYNGLYIYYTILYCFIRYMITLHYCTYRHVYFLTQRLNHRPTTISAWCIMPWPENVCEPMNMGMGM